jgi:hypothetical protein
MRLARRTWLILVAPVALAATLAAVAVGGAAPTGDAAAQGSQATERLELTIRGREMRARLVDEPPLRRGHRRPRDHRRHRPLRGRARHDDRGHRPRERRDRAGADALSA